MGLWNITLGKTRRPFSNDCILPKGKEVNFLAKGVDIINGEYPHGVLRGLKFSDKKIQSNKFLGENLRSLKSISKFD